MNLSRKKELKAFLKRQAAIKHRFNLPAASNKDPR